MLVEALQYPLEEDDYIETLIIGSLLVIGSILIIPAFILMGYVARTVRNASNGEPAPTFGDYKGLFIDGLKLTAVGLIYLLGLIVLMLLTSVAGELSQIAGIAMFWITAVAYFGLSYISISVLYHFSQEGSIKDALQIRNVLETASSFKYLKVVLFYLVVYIMLSIIQLILVFTIVGILLVPASLIYEITVYSKLVGDIEA